MSRSPIICFSLLAIGCGCSLLVDPEIRFDAGPSGPIDSSLLDAPPVIIDAAPPPDATDCMGRPKLTLNVTNATGPGGSVDVRQNGALLGVCNVDQLGCVYCLNEGATIYLDAKPFTGSVFQKWSTACAPLCMNGIDTTPCQFAMPNSNVGCLADFQQSGN